MVAHARHCRSCLRTITAHNLRLHLVEQIVVGEDLLDAFASGVEPCGKLRADQPGVASVTNLLRILVEDHAVDFAERARLKLLAGEPFDALLHSAQLAKSLGC